MSNTKRKREQEKEKISVDRWIAMLSGIMAVAGWALLIMANRPSCDPPPNRPPTIQEFRVGRETLAVGETVDARIFVEDPDLPDDEIHYFWAARKGRIGVQPIRFQGSQVTYVAPDHPVDDVITVVVYDQEGKTDKDFKIITITERGER